MVETAKIHTEFPEHRWLIADIDALNIANGKLNEPFSSVGPFDWPCSTTPTLDRSKHQVLQAWQCLHHKKHT